jgi:hypothetical protein
VEVEEEKGETFFCMLYQKNIIVPSNMLGLSKVKRRMQ